GELLDITRQFEALNQRKAQLEAVVEALRPLFMDAPEAAVAPAEFKAPEIAPFLVQSVETAEEPVLEPAVVGYEEPAVYAEESSDPFQRRIDNALRQGFGGRDSRVMSLGLNGLLTRA
ncbi:MAG TPA: hypothetical protein VG893_08130, partial [Terracidiphilus sp.]|nr:hypothetical protein [Terracidiphilus sp.]